VLNFLRQALGIFPCPGCGAPSDKCNAFCRECREKMKLFDGIRCPGCGGELDGALAQCSKCLREELRPWRYAVSCFPYSGYGKLLVQRFKFGGFPELARPFGFIAAERLKEISEPMDMMTSVPLFFTRCWSRSYNQSALFASICARDLHVPFRQVMFRTRPTPHQAALPRKMRVKNLKGAFAVWPWIRLDGLNVWVLDDVFTTGSTLHEAAETLLDAGAAGVRVLTLARA